MSDIYSVDVVLDDSALTVELALDVVLGVERLLGHFGGDLQLLVLGEQGCVELSQLGSRRTPGHQVDLLLIVISESNLKAIVQSL